MLDQYNGLQSGFLQARENFSTTFFAGLRQAHRPNEMAQAGSMVCYAVPEDPLLKLN